MDDLNISLVKRAPSKVFYIPNFIDEETEQKLTLEIENAPKRKWTELSNRRLQNWGGLPHEKGMVAEDIPKWLAREMEAVSSLGIYGEDRKANHVLINEYRPGQGIMAHVDGPMFYPTIATINLGGQILLNLYHKHNTDEKMDLKSSAIGSLLLERRSLLIMQEGAYTSYMHDISQAAFDVLCPSSLLNWKLTAFGKNEKELQNCLKNIGLVAEMEEEKVQNCENVANFVEKCNVPENSKDMLFEEVKRLDRLNANKSDTTIIEDEKTTSESKETIISSVDELSNLLKEPNCNNILGINYNGQLMYALKRCTRISLTIRNVPKVLKSSLIFGKKRL